MKAREYVCCMHTCSQPTVTADPMVVCCCLTNAVTRWWVTYLENQCLLKTNSPWPYPEHNTTQHNTTQHNTTQHNGFTMATLLASLGSLLHTCILRVSNLIFRKLISKPMQAPQGAKPSFKATPLQLAIDIFF